MRLIIFTDLDGSLLDHFGCDFSAAGPSLARIGSEGIPLIMATSKTRTEVARLQQEMGIREPFIVENGGGVFFPRAYRGWRIAVGERQADYVLLRLGTTYAEVRRFLERWGAAFGIRGFGDMTTEEIAERTGLSPQKARLARAREFTEPFVMSRPEVLGDLEAQAAAAGLKVTRGGRFYHLIGTGQDKGLAVRIVRDIFRVRCGPLKAVGLGDSENDVPMLAEVDIPVVIPRPDGSRLNIARRDVIRAKLPGSAGWNDAVSALLERHAGAAAEGP